MRFLVAFIFVMAGCVMTLPDDAGITADLACEQARAVVLASAKPDTPDVPDDKPKPGGKCTNCDGRGYVGDGTIKVQCQPCGGTGKTK